MCTCLSSSRTSLPPVPHPAHLGHHRAELGSLQQLPSSLLFCSWQCIYVTAILPVCPTLPFICWVHQSILYMCVSIPALQMGSSVSFFHIPYICINKLLLHMTASKHSSYFIILYLPVQLPILFGFFLPLSPAISTLGLFLEAGLLQGSVAPSSGNWINFLIQPTFLFLRETI